MPTEFPCRPWQKVGADLMELKGKSYLVGVCYYSRYIEIIPLHCTSSLAIINGMKSIYARQGIADKLLTDLNSPLLSS